MRDHNYFVYILASRSGVLYIGVTNNLERRIVEHETGLFDGFTKKYKCDRLVYFELTSEVTSALEREKQLKGWSRFKKMSLIKTLNPEWKDLSRPDPSTPSNSARDDK